ncbi:MAG: AAA family ATPase [Candidatus Diapherotrites archaeon]
MRLGITGTPGVGKTSIAKELGEFFQFKVVNEKDFCIKKGIAEIDEKTNEILVDIEKLEKKLNAFLKTFKNVIVEGHMICETKANFDYVIVITCNPEILEFRLSMRGYNEEKIQDNVFCEGIDYCKKWVLRNYDKEKVIIIENRKSIKETALSIILEIERRERGKSAQK